MAKLKMNFQFNQLQFYLLTTLLLKTIMINGQDGMFTMLTGKITERRKR